jgi:myo-inositol-1(or 4)-monophosphatase
VGHEPPARPAAADVDAELALLTRSVRAAGERALGYFRTNVRQWAKPDGSPVSDADIAVDEALSAALRSARPHHGWISEELGGVAGSGRAFVVDPIDGTRAFLAGEEGWTVVAAVVEAGRPLAAAIYRPVRDELYAASLGAGAFRNGERLGTSGRSALAGATVAMPGGLFREAGLKDAGVKRAGWVPSLALRLARVARGMPDAVITKAGPHHWDLAAADLIVHEAGGTITGLAGSVLQYDAIETRHGPVVAGPPALAEALRNRAAGHFAGAA